MISLLEFFHSIDAIVLEIVATSFVQRIWELILRIPAYSYLIDFIRDIWVTYPETHVLIMLNILLTMIKTISKGIIFIIRKLSIFKKKKVQKKNPNSNSKPKLMALPIDEEAA